MTRTEVERKAADKAAADKAAADKAAAEKAPAEKAAEEKKTAGPLGLGPTRTFWLLLIGLLAFGLVTWWMVTRATDLPANDEVAWLRAVTVYDGALAFLSFLVGALTGVAVQVQRVQDARQKAAEAKKAEQEAKAEEVEARRQESEAKRAERESATTATLGRALSDQVLAAYEQEKAGPSVHVAQPSFGTVSPNGEVHQLWRQQPGVAHDVLVAPSSSVEPVSPALALLASLATQVQQRPAPMP